MRRLQRQQVADFAAAGGPQLVGVHRAGRRDLNTILGSGRRVFVVRGVVGRELFRSTISCCASRASTVWRLSNVIDLSPYAAIDMSSLTYWPATYSLSGRSGLIAIARPGTDPLRRRRTSVVRVVLTVRPLQLRQRHDLVIEAGGRVADRAPVDVVLSTSGRKRSLSAVGREHTSPDIHPLATPGSATVGSQIASSAVAGP
jgi:hypothetical protein